MFFHDNTTKMAIITVVMFACMFPLLQVQFPKAENLVMSMYMFAVMFAFWKISEK